MTNTKTTKRALFASILSLLLCVSMLIGSTFAWFTDTASTGVNVIKSGSLEIAFEYAEGKEAPATATWNNAEGAKIFDYEKWEPGYTVAKHIKITNKGTLALKYQLDFMINGEIGKLAEVIDVYFADPAVQVADRTAATNLKYVGNLKTFLENTAINPENGHLLEGESATVTIVLKMQETANNDYQNKSVGDGLTVAVVATQYTEETDSFDKNYDANAIYPISVTDLSGFQAAIAKVPNNGTISLNNNMTITGSNGGDLNGTNKTTNIALNGNTVTASTGNAGFGIRNNATANISGGTVIADANTYTAVLARYEGAVANVSNMTLSNSLANGTALCARDKGVINVENTVINSTIGGCADANAGTITVKNCTFNQTGTDTDNRSTLFIACYSGEININGGDYTGANKGLYIITSGGTFNVYGGNFKANEVIRADHTNYDNSYPGATAVFNIYGGNFDGKIVVNGTSANTVNIEAGTFSNTGLTLEQFKAYVAEGSTVTEANGVFTVTK